MTSRAKRSVGLFWAILFYQGLFLILTILLINLGMILIIRNEVIRFTGEELAKRNKLLQLTLEDAFHPDLPPRPDPASGETFPLTDPETPPPHRRPPPMVIEELENRIRKACELTGTRFMVISPEGEINFDSEGAGESENQLEYPEIATLAAGGETGLDIREDSLTGLPAIYQALPLMAPDGSLTGFTRVSQPARAARELHDRILQSIRLGNLIALALIILILLPLTRNMIALVGRLEHRAGEISRGNFDLTGPETNIREFRALIGAMDRMSHTLRDQFSTIEEQNRRLTEQSLVDELTGLGNRRKYNQALEYHWWLCLRGGHPISLLILDIDKFKQYNDSLGHPRGDLCLREIGRLLRETARRHTDIPVRLGGEEFGILLPETDDTQAEAIGHRLLDRINREALPHPDSPVAPHVTVSIGLTTLVPTESASPESLLEGADRALYRAKEGGRNRLERETLS